MATTDLTEDTFEATVTQPGIVLVDFWATWCPPCRQFGPIFEAASEVHSDIVFAKLDTDAEQNIAAEHAITSIPTLMAFRDGILLYAQPGALPAAGLEQVISAVREVDMDAVRSELDAEESTGADAPAPGHDHH